MPQIDNATLPPPARSEKIIAAATTVYSQEAFVQRATLALLHGVATNHFWDDQRLIAEKATKTAMWVWKTLKDKSDAQLLDVKPLADPNTAASPVLQKPVMAPGQAADDKACPGIKAETEREAHAFEEPEDWGIRQTLHDLHHLTSGELGGF